MAAASSNSITEDNIVVLNQGKNPLVNFHFMLRVEGLYDLPCKSVHAFSRELEYDFIQEGGLNDYVHMRRKPISKPFTLEVDRYVGVDYFDPLQLGLDLILPVMLIVSRSSHQFNPFAAARTYVFTGVSVIKKSYSELSSDIAGLLVETTTLSYREMLCIDAPWSEALIGSDTSLRKNDNTQIVSNQPSIESIKADGLSWYDKAKKANDNCIIIWSPNVFDQLKIDLEAAITLLENALADNGSIKGLIAAAERGLISPEGKTYLELALEAEAVVDELNQELNKSKLALRAKSPEYQAALDKAAKSVSAAYAPSRATQRLKEQIETETTTLETNKKALAEMEEQVNTLKTAIDDAKKAMDDTEKSVEAAKEVESTVNEALSTAKEAESTAKEEHNLATEALNLLQGQLSALPEDAPEEQRTEIQTQLTKAQEELGEAQGKLNSCTTSVRAATAALLSTQETIKEAEEILATAKGAYEESQKKHETMATDIADFKEEIATAEASIKDLEAKHAKAKSESDPLVETANADRKTADELGQETIPLQNDYQEKSLAYSEGIQAANNKRGLANAAQGELDVAEVTYNNANNVLSQLKRNYNSVDNKKNEALNAFEKCTEEFALCKDTNNSLQTATEIADAKHLCDKVETLSRGVSAKEIIVSLAINFVKVTQDHIADAERFLNINPTI